MPQRSEPEILADLIRLAEIIERDAVDADKIAVAAGEANPQYIAKAYADELRKRSELIEQARAALHRYVVARGKVRLTMPRAPLTLWTGACFAIGALAGAAALALDFPPWLPIIAAALVLVGASIIIDRKHL